MEPQPLESSFPADLQNLRIDVLRQAVAIYMALSYPDGVLPAIVAGRLDWPNEANAEKLLSKSPFETAGANKSTGTPIFALRLGNARYPHMKLQIQPWPNSSGFLLSVNTHDQVLALDPSAQGLSAFKEIQTENQRLKEVIEQAWDDAKLPTFLRYLREYIENRG